MGELTSAQDRGLTEILYGLAASLAYPSGEKGGILLVKMISTCPSLRFEVIYGNIEL
jgi:hypothetical protein